MNRICTYEFYLQLFDMHTSNIYIYICSKFVIVRLNWFAINTKKIALVIHPAGEFGRWFWILFLFFPCLYCDTASIEMITSIISQGKLQIPEHAVLSLRIIVQTHSEYVMDALTHMYRERIYHYCSTHPITYRASWLWYSCKARTCSCKRRGNRSLVLRVHGWWAAYMYCVLYQWSFRINWYSRYAKTCKFHT